MHSYGMCIAVFVCTDTYILYYNVTIGHDVTTTGDGDSSTGNGDMNNPFEEDMTGGGNICDISCLKASAHMCIHIQDCTHPPNTYL